MYGLFGMKLNIFQKVFQFFHIWLAKLFEKTFSLRLHFPLKTGNSLGMVKEVSLQENWDATTLALEFLDEVWGVGFGEYR